MFKKITVRSFIQAISLLLFLLLLTFCATGFATKLFSIFLMMDPLSAIITSISSRSLIIWVIVPVLTILLTVIFGRIFCGYICPMGTTIDIFDKLSGTKTNNKYPSLQKFRFIILFGVIAAAVLGVNLVFHFLPISLATRFYGLIIYPFSAASISEVIQTGQRYFDMFGFFSVEHKRYSSILFIAVLFVGLFIVSRKSKRFWCKYLCPTGAFLGLLSVFAPYKRNVGGTCDKCGKCQKQCPTNAIQNVLNHNPYECISCKKCVNICPTNAVSFNIKQAEVNIYPIGLTRRDVLTGLSAGGAVALLSMTELKSIFYKVTEHGDLVYVGLIRPPGAIPEKEFLAKCVRCGQCMAACPTNALQPLIMQSGSAAIFSPIVVPLRGKCETSCNLCGAACPTGAIKELSLNEKQHAKIGTARILKQRCLAWQNRKECIVCGEVCPYNAMKLVPEDGYTVTVPKVDDNRCFGCGACEHSCPVEIPAVIVEPVKALRLNNSNYTERSKELGLDLTVNSEQKIFNNEDYDGLPPGFVE